MKEILAFALYLTGLISLARIFISSVPYSVKKAVNSRNRHSRSETQRLIQGISKKIAPHIKLGVDSERKISAELGRLRLDKTAQQYIAELISNALFYGAFGLLAMIINIWLGLVLSVALFVTSILLQRRALKKELEKKRKIIEQDLPQFAGTIRQQLSTTHDIVSILKTYQRVCSPELKDEINRTVNEIKTNSTEAALQGLERRVGGAALSEVVRGLISVYHGEDQTMFFELLTEDLVKQQMESVVKELEKRPTRLAPYFMGIVLCVLIIAIYSLIGSVNMNVLAF